VVEQNRQIWLKYSCEVSYQSQLFAIDLCHSHKDLVFKIVASLFQVHGPQQTQYCSNAAFFRRMHSFTEAPPPAARPPLSGSLSKSLLFCFLLSIIAVNSSLLFFCTDIEDLLPVQARAANLPLMVELDLCRGGDLLSDQLLLQGFERLRARFPPDHHFVLKLNGGLARDMQQLNQKVQQTTRFHRCCFVVVVNSMR
jgi:hypothetical protein